MLDETAADPRHLNEASFRLRAARGLLREPAEGIPDQGHQGWHGPSDFDLDPQMFWEIAGQDLLRPAAVLVPIMRHAELTVLLTTRTVHLPSHAGQISFPGGKVEPDDASPLDAALREAEEEIGLDRGHVEPLGYLDCYRTGTGYAITPVVAVVDPAFTPRPDLREVAEVFEVPLAFLLDAANHELHTRVLAGRARRFHAIGFGDRFIWGATAGIIKNLHARFAEP